MLPHDVLNGLENSFGPVRLRHELALRRHLLGAGFFFSRGDDDFDRRPSPADCGGEFQPVHRSRHIDIGDDDPNIVARFQDGDGLGGVRGRDDLVRNSSSTVKITVILPACLWQRLFEFLVPANEIIIE